MSSGTPALSNSFFCSFLAWFSPARALLLHVVYCPFYLTCHLLVYSSTSHFPLLLSLVFSVLLFATMVCLPSFLSCVGAWLDGSHSCLVQVSHRHRGAPPGSRRGQGREVRENERWNGGHADGHTPTTRPRGQGATCAIPGVRVGVLRAHNFF